MWLFNFKFPKNFKWKLKYNIVYMLYLIFPLFKEQISPTMQGSHTYHNGFFFYIARTGHT